jgi:hypothetical protein
MEIVCEKASERSWQQTFYHTAESLNSEGLGEVNCVVVAIFEWLCRGLDRDWVVVVLLPGRASLGQQRVFDARGVVVGGQDWWVLFSNAGGLCGLKV